MKTNSINTDWYNLDVAFGKFMYPRIMKLIEKGDGYPAFEKSHKSWLTKLRKMAKSFEWLADENRSSFDVTPKFVRKGMTLFADNVEHLWD